MFVAAVINNPISSISDIQLLFGSQHTSQLRQNLKMHTLPTNQLRPPASITDMTAFWCHCTLFSERGSLKSWKGSGVVAILSTEDSRLSMSIRTFPYTSTRKLIKPHTIEITCTSIFCKNPAFPALVLDRVSSAGSAPAMVFNWTTAAEKRY